MMHPYKTLPDRQFWSRAVSSGFDAAEVGTFPRPLIRAGDRIVSAGSCFAANIVPHLERAGFTYLRTEYTEPVWAEIVPEAMSYAKFSAGYGNIYTTRQLRQLLRRCLGRFTPREDRWAADDAVIDPYRPGLRYPARTAAEFDALQAQHLKATLEAFSSCDVFIFTLGLTEAWASTLDGAVFPACPGTIAGTYDAARHAFVNFSVNEVALDLVRFIEELRSVNPKVRVILTVSPVPLVATNAGRHVLAATTYSKAVLRVAAEMTVSALPDVHYFPAYEIVTGPQAPEPYFEPDRRNVSSTAIDAVMVAFLAACDSSRATQQQAPAPNAAQALSAAISEIECEEAGQDR